MALLLSLLPLCPHAIAIAALLLASPFPAAAGAAGDDYPEGSKIAWEPWEPWQPQPFGRSEAAGRLLFVYFHGQWCTWCRAFQSESLESPGVVAALRDRYVPVLVDVDKRADLFRRYGGRGLPFVVILDQDGGVLTRFTGHLAAADLRSVLEEQQRPTSVTGRQITPDGVPIDSLDGFMAMLEEAYDPATRRLSGSPSFGTLSKRPQPWTYRFLLEADGWEARMPGMLEQVVEDLYDPIEGGFFFFRDPHQGDPRLAVETSKRLDQNAAFLWLFADAYASYGHARYADIARGVSNYLRERLWDADRRRFANSQYADPDYYALDRAERLGKTPPRVDASTYADTSGQAIAALANLARVAKDAAILGWAETAMQALDARLGSASGFLYRLTPEGRAHTAGYLPAQIWPEIAREELARAIHALRGERPAGPDPSAALDRLARYFDPHLGALAERLASGLDPWSETRTQAALAWLLHRLPGEVGNASDLPVAGLRAQLRIAPGADPDDVALGFQALRRGLPRSTVTNGPMICADALPIRRSPSAWSWAKDPSLDQRLVHVRAPNLFPINPAILAGVRRAFTPSRAKDHPSNAALVVIARMRPSPSRPVWSSVARAGRRSPSCRSMW